MERFFNTAGPQIPDINYTIDPLSRLNLDEMLSLIRQQRYFVLHALSVPKNESFTAVTPTSTSS